MNSFSQGNTLQVINYIAASLSLIGSLLMIYFCCKSTRTVSTKLILSIAISDLLYSLVNMMSGFEDQVINTFCRAEGFLRQFFFDSSLLWATSTAIFCYKQLKGGRSFNADQFFIICVIVNTIIGLVIALA